MRDSKNVYVDAYKYRDTLTLILYNCPANTLNKMLVKADLTISFSTNDPGVGYSHMKAVRVCAAVKPPFFEFY